MSFITNLFGRKGKDKMLTTEETTQKIRETKKMLITKQQCLENKIEIEINKAKKNAVKNKRVAIKGLKRKKRYTKQLEQINEILVKIELNREALETSSTNALVLTTMKEAANALKEANKYVPNPRTIAKVDAIMGDAADLVEQQDLVKEIWDAVDAIHKPVIFDVHQDELEKELEALQQESLENKLLEVGSKNVPAVNQVEIVKPRPTPTRKVVDDYGMKELEAWAR